LFDVYVNVNYDRKTGASVTVALALASNRANVYPLTTSDLRATPSSMTTASLHTHADVVTIDNMPAQLITRFKNINPDGSIMELVVWRVPQPVPPTEHGYKYRAVYVRDGQRVVGFDNERGKGDHCHLDGQELPYQFVSVEQLVEDFIAAVSSRRPT
jgi:hypothetical protein